MKQLRSTTKNDLSPEVREKAAALLNQQLADTTDREQE